MEFNEKLRELRKNRGITQEELAAALYVSRTAISKWESGRGYPNLDSLRALAAFFSVTVDELLGGEAVLNIAQEEQKQLKKDVRSGLFAAADTGGVLLLLLPLFREKTGEAFHSVPLWLLSGAETYTKAAFFLLAAALCLWGVLCLMIRREQGTFSPQNRERCSLILSVLAALAFILALQPYAAGLTLVLMMFKVFARFKTP